MSTRRKTDNQSQVGRASLCSGTLVCLVLVVFAGLSQASAGQSPEPASPKQGRAVHLNASDWFTAQGTEWYSAFNQPSAQYRNGKTYVVFPDEVMDPAIICYDHVRRTWSETVKIGKNPLSPRHDSHGNPALLIDQTGYFHVFYGCHGGPMQYARSANPESIRSWTAMAAPAPRATYPQVMQMSNGTIYLFYRAGGHCDDWVYRTSSDGGNGWSQATAVIRGVRPQDAWYVSFVRGPNDTVHAGFIWKEDNNARKAAGPEFTHRYDAFYIRMTPDGTWYSPAGTTLQLALSKADANSPCKVYDSLSSNHFTGASSVGVDQEGTAYLMFRVGGPYGTTTYQHKLARIKQGNWDIFEVGPVVDCGYAAYVRDDNFLLQVVSPKLLRAYVVQLTAGSPVRTQVDLWESTDGARTWTRQNPLFSSTEYPAEYVLIAPKLVRDARPEAQLVFGQSKRYLYGDSGFVKREASQ